METLTENFKEPGKIDELFSLLLLEEFPKLAVSSLCAVILLARPDDTGSATTRAASMGS
jgi:hypothetical protein